MEETNEPVAVEPETPVPSPSSEVDLEKREAAIATSIDALNKA